jgi:cytochrome bd-type quinol oxidase subunit 2
MRILKAIFGGWVIAFIAGFVIALLLLGVTMTLRTMGFEPTQSMIAEFAAVGKILTGLSGLLGGVWIYTRSKQTDSKDAAATAKTDGAVRETRVDSEHA